MIDLRCGDALAVLRTLPAGFARCCVTSPPYWGLRDYGVPGQLGLERTPDEYVARMVAVFAEVRRVLAEDGTLWLNLGDSYAANRSCQVSPTKWQSLPQGQASEVPPGLKPKDLVGVPWRVAFALQVDGWYLRSDIVWAKPNPMPESVTDRPTKAHEYVFLLSKRERYYYNGAAIKEPVVYGDHPRNGAPGPPIQAPGQPVQSGITRRRRSGNKARRIARGPGERPADHLGTGVPWDDVDGRRNRRSVWAIATQPFAEAHFAVMPEALVEPCILAGSAPGDLVLDTFAGSGTVGVVALRHGRRFVGIELNPEYVAMARKRIQGPLFVASGSDGR